MIKRHALPSIYQNLQAFPAVLLIGARQNGKSTVAQQLVKEGCLDEYVSLDDFNYLAQAKTDPDGFIAQFANKRIALDEIQRVPDLMRALKKQIDSKKQKGQFLLTGSANILAYPSVSESLAGRMAIMHLEGLSLGELYQIEQPSAFIRECFSETLPLAAWEAKLKSGPKLTKQILVDLLYCGGYPESALTRAPQFTKTWFNSYLMSYIERDVRDLSKLLDVVTFGNCFRLLGTRTGNLLNIKNIANDVGLDQRAVTRYIEILEITFQASTLQPWFANIRKRLVKSPKLYLNDSAAACQLFAIDDTQHLLNHPYLGAIFETWVWAEMRKLLSLEFAIQPYFYRTHTDKEVDFILKKGETYCAFEVKFSDKVTASDFNALRDFQDSVGKAANAIILYTGEKLLRFPDNGFAVPVSIFV